MRASRVIIATSTIAFFALVASTTAATTAPPSVPREPSPSAASVAVTQLQQNDNEELWVALDTDGDRRFDDANRDGKPDHWFKVAKKFVINCGPLIGCLVTTQGVGLLFCATPSLFQCLDAYSDDK